MNAVNMFILTTLLFIFLAPIAFFMTALAIYVYRLLVKEPLIGLAPIERRPARTRTPIPARRVTVVRELMRDLDLKVPKQAMVAPVMAAMSAADLRPAGVYAVVERAAAQPLAVGTAARPIEAMALVEPDVEWRDEAEVTPNPATDKRVDAAPEPLAATAAPFMATNFATERVATVDGASIDLLGRLFPKRATTRGDDKIIVLAHERARREEAPETDRRAAPLAETGGSDEVPNEAVEELVPTPDDAIARLRRVAERGLADYLATRLPERVETSAVTANLDGEMADQSPVASMAEPADEADIARFAAEVDTAVSEADLSEFTGQSLVATPVIEVPLEEAAAAFVQSRRQGPTPGGTGPVLA
jgi:hypothetical protein